MHRSLQCQCGALRGQLKHAEKAKHLMCYCKDCQAFAHYLGKADVMLDAHHGVDIVVSHPQEIEFADGADKLACMSLSEEGMLRWYASCCNTPIGNTGRTTGLAYVGLSAACLGDPATLNGVVGPVRMRSCTDSAKGTVAPTGKLASVPVLLGFGVDLLRARLSGSYRRNPFFKPGTSEPVAPRKVLTAQERERLRAIG